MEFPSKIMTVKELIAFDRHFTREYLMELYRRQSEYGFNYKYAWKKNQFAKNSPILFDTDELGKYLKRQCNGL